jgi:hypothetical protein
MSMDPTNKLQQPFGASPFNAKTKHGTEIVQELPRRQEKLMMEQLRAEMRDLHTEIERLTQVNCTLEERLRVTVDKLQIAETKLQIQKKAWQSIAADNNQDAAHLMLPGEPHKNIPRLALKNIASEGHHRSEVKAVSSQPSRRPMSARPASSRPASGRQNVPISHDGQTQVGTDNGSHVLNETTKRPFSARNTKVSTPWSTPRYETRPSSARPVLGSSEGGSTTERGAIFQRVAKDPLFTKFQPNVPSSDGQLSFGRFAANAMLSQKAAQIVAQNMSEQSATFGSLGLYLMCMWKEVNNCTANEPTPNYFRLAIACKIFDQVLGVVGMYSDLLMELRSEMFASLFQGFDARKVCATCSPHWHSLCIKLVFMHSSLAAFQSCCACVCMCVRVCVSVFS